MFYKIYNKYLYFTFLFLFPWELFKINFYYDLNFLIKLFIGLTIVLSGYFTLKFIFNILKINDPKLYKIIFALSFCYFLESSVIELESILYRIILLIIIFLFIILLKSKRFINSILIFSIFFILFTFIKGNFIYLKKKFQTNKISYDYSKNIYANKENKGLILIFLDELSSLKYYENDDLALKKDISKFRDIFLKYKFNLHNNTFSNYSETIYSIPSVLNSYNDLDIDKISKTHSRNNIYIDLKKNLLFNNWKNKIYVFQDSAINFCEKNIINILECDTKAHLPVPSTSEFLVKNSFLKIIYDKFFYFIYFKIKKYYPEIFYDIYLKRNSKSLFDKTLEKISEISLLHEKDDLGLFFVHALTPHTPFVYRNDCSLGFIDNDNLELNIKKKLHANELKCLSKIFDKFFNTLKSNKLIDNFEIIIASDHGNRFEDNFISKYSTFLGYRGNKYLENKNMLISIQNLIPKIIYEEFDENSESNNKFYNTDLNKFIQIN